MSMFCFQCEQAKGSAGCDSFRGTCGKEESTAEMQDLIIYGLKGLSYYAARSAEKGFANRQVSEMIIDGLFFTVTNVNFDDQRHTEFIARLADVRVKAKKMFEEAWGKQMGLAGSAPETAQWEPKPAVSDMQAKSIELGIKRKLDLYPDRTSLEELVTYGLKGAAAYAHHAMVLGWYNQDVLNGFAKLLDELNRVHSIEELAGLAMQTGALNLQVMEALDTAHTTTFGHPEPTKVRVTPIKGKAILISGHDLADLKALLEQTEGKGINVYTHSEMLPALAYPELKKFKHLTGNFGGAWQDQQKEFGEFAGPIVMTTNCIQKPFDDYNDRIYTLNLVGWPGVKHIENRDFSAVIEQALNMEGFTADGPEQYITIGFGHNATLGVADAVIDAVKTGQIKHFFLVGGCDGARPGRNYYTDFAEQAPADTVILTLACGKYRFNKHEFGTIGGIPRLLDIGQCNDAYSAIKIATALAQAFNCSVNELPLSLVLSWFEQKAVAILLTLLHLGIKNIKLGPTLPAFITPNVLNFLVENFKIAPITTAQADLEAILTK